VKNGIPYDVAMSLEVDEVMAHGIIFGEMEGNKWDWSRMRWEPPKRT
jgi:hypothetical protein